MKLTRLQKLLGILLPILLVRVVIVPFVSWRDDVVKNIESMHSKVQKLESIYSSREKITNSMSELEGCIEQVQQYFLPVSDAGESAQLNIQKYLEETVNSMGIKLTNLEWMYQSPGPLFTQVPLKLTFQCYLDQLYALVHSIETHTVFLTIDSISVAADKNVKLACTMEISAYSLNPALFPAR